MIDGIKKNIEKSIASFLDKIKIDYKLHLVNSLLYTSIREYSLRRGKRLRPLLLILTYKGYSKKQISQSLYNASTCIEFLHNFMLIHDDIIDSSNLRRGKPTLHRILAKAIKTPNQKKLGSDLGIIAGDIVYALAIDAFLSVEEPPLRKERALKYFIQTAAFTAMGEFIDTIHGVEDLNRVSEKDVFLNYTLKTARYTFDCPMVTGAILAGAPEKDIKLLSKMGILVGQAFQIQDDIIGIFDTEKNIGKSILSDLAESKKTLLVCYTYQKMSPSQKRNFRALFNKPKKNYQDLITIRKIFINSGSLQYSLDHLDKRLNQTLKILDTLSMNKPVKTVIRNSILDLFTHSRQLAGQYGL